MNDSTTSLGERIKAARLKMRYTIKQAAQTWNFKQSRLVNWEYNDMTPREPYKTKLETILKEIENK